MASCSSITEFSSSLYDSPSSYMLIISLSLSRSCAHRQRDEKLKDELRRASEEKESLIGKSIKKDDKSQRSKRESSSSSDKVHMEEPMGPSICPDSVFQTLVHK